MRFACAVLLCVSLLAAACGGDDADGDALPTPSGPPLSDAEYVQSLCDAIKTWNDATLTKSTADELRTVLDEFVKDMKLVNPPVDARPFHAGFVKYLEDARSDPTLLITREPALPEEPVRNRLAEAERNATCVAPVFSRSTATPTPGQ